MSSRSLPRYNRILPDWVQAQKDVRNTCAENCPGPATQKGCLTARQALPRQRVDLASPDNSDTHGSTRPLKCVSARPARPARQRRTLGIQQRRHRRRTAGPAELQTIQLRLCHSPAVRRLRLSESELCPGAPPPPVHDCGCGLPRCLPAPVFH